MLLVVSHYNLSAEQERARRSHLGDLIIANHANLRQYDGLYGIQSVGGDLRITEATALSAEELTALEAALDGIAIEGELVVSAGE